MISFVYTVNALHFTFKSSGLESIMFFKSSLLFMYGKHTRPTCLQESEELQNNCVIFLNISFPFNNWSFAELYLIFKILWDLFPSSWNVEDFTSIWIMVLSCLITNIMSNSEFGLRNSSNLRKKCSFFFWLSILFSRYFFDCL